MPLTLEDIARHAGCSRSTVSRVINGDPNVSPKTRHTVQQVLQRFDFQPNLAARGLAAGRSGVIGLVIPRGVGAIFTDPFFPALIQGISSACNARDYSMMLWMAEPQFERRLVSRILYNGLVDGVIVSSMLVDDPLVEALARGQLPFVLIGRHPTDETVSYVDTDNLQAARQAVQHLLRLGRRRVAAITGPQNMIVGIDRLQGYRDALQAAGLPFLAELTAEGDFTDEGGYRGMQRLLAQRPDALFAASDSMALGALAAIHEAGLRVPQDIAVVGFDDVPLAARTSPLLTTVRQPIQREGALAAETLIERIETRPAGAQHLVLPAELVVRQSCGSNL